MRPSLFAFVVVVVAASGCALRPLYKDLVAQAPADAKSLELVLQDASTHQPLPGVKLELSEGKSRLQLTTGPDGRFTLPVDKKYRDENPLLVVAMPAGVLATEVVAAPLPSPAPSPVPVPPAAPAPAASVEPAPPAPPPSPAAPATP